MSDVAWEMLDDLILKGAPKDDTLETSLDAYTKPNLVKIAEANDFEVKQSWNKGQMTEVISDGLRDSLNERLSTFENEELKVLQELLDGNTENVEKHSEVISSAVNKGLLYVSFDDEKALFTMPAEFEEKLTEIVNNDKADESEEEAVSEADDQSTRTVPFTSRPRRKQPVQQRIVGEKLGRNEPCHCGSGKKYKKCCWRKDQIS